MSRERGPGSSPLALACWSVPELSRQGNPNSEHKSNMLLDFQFSFSCLTAAKAQVSIQCEGLVSRRLEFSSWWLGEPRRPKPVGALTSMAITKFAQLWGNAIAAHNASSHESTLSRLTQKDIGVLYFITCQRYLPFPFHALRKRCFKFPVSYISSTAQKYTEGDCCLQLIFMTCSLWLFFSLHLEMQEVVLL